MFKEKNIQFLIASNNISEIDKFRLKNYNVKILDDIKNKDIHELYKLSDLFIFPSRFEWCSFSILEAMSTWLPFVISKVWSALDIYEDNQKLKNYILEWLDVNLWEERILDLLNNEKLYEDISREVRNYAIKHYSLNVFEENYIWFIRSIEKRSK